VHQLVIKEGSVLLMHGVTMKFFFNFFFFVWRFEAIPGHGLLLRGFGITFTGQTTLGRTPLYQRSVRRRDLCFKTHNTHNRQISMPPAGFEITIPPSERPQTDALNRAFTGIGIHQNW